MGLDKLRKKLEDRQSESIGDKKIDTNMRICKINISVHKTEKWYRKHLFLYRVIMPISSKNHHPPPLI